MLNDICYRQRRIWFSLGLLISCIRIFPQANMIRNSFSVMLENYVIIPNIYCFLTRSTVSTRDQSWRTSQFVTAFILDQHTLVGKNRTLRFAGRHLPRNYDANIHVPSQHDCLFLLAANMQHGTQPTTGLFNRKNQPNHSGSQPSIFSPLSLVGHLEGSPIKTTEVSVSNHRNEPCFDPRDPVRIVAQAHTNASIRCTVHNSNFTSIVMSWWKEGDLKELTVGHVVSHKRYRIDKSIPQSWTLVIQNVTEEDAGNYICQINLSKLKEKFFHLSVFVPDEPLDNRRNLDDQYVKDEAVTYNLTAPRDVWIEGKQYGTWGQAHRLMCFAKSQQNALSSSILWFHNKQRIYLPTLPESHGVNNRVSKGEPTRKMPYIVSSKWFNDTTFVSVLHITKLTDEHTGLWVCSKYSRTYMEPSAEASIFLKVIAKNRTQDTKYPRYKTNDHGIRPQMMAAVQLTIISVVLSLYT
ncbi:unnamed protein product [Dicrocoelium dendriticum]|nr:unnamed protein product [Dicrocoelium dendriticum]